MRHLRMLGISKEKLNEFSTLEEMQDYGHCYYKKILPEFHPDTAHRRKRSVKRRPVGQTFLAIHESHGWLMSLTDDDITGYVKKHETVYDCPLPDHMSRFNDPILLPWGYNETREWLNYQ